MAGTDLPFPTNPQGETVFVQDTGIIQAASDSSQERRNTRTRTLAPDTTVTGTSTQLQPHNTPKPSLAQMQALNQDWLSKRQMELILEFS